MSGRGERRPPLGARPVPRLALRGVASLALVFSAACEAPAPPRATAPPRQLAPVERPLSSPPHGRIVDRAAPSIARGGARARAVPEPVAVRAQLERRLATRARGDRPCEGLRAILAAAADPDRPLPSPDGDDLQALCASIPEDLRACLDPDHARANVAACRDVFARLSREGEAQIEAAEVRVRPRDRSRAAPR